MNNLHDLNIPTDLLPLFDHSLNAFTRKKILHVLENPLPSVNEITLRQNILRGFEASNNILKDYSYTVIYLKEVHAFLNDEKAGDISQNTINYKLFVSKEEKARDRGRFSQFVMLFHRLYSNYFSRLDLTRFPGEYQASIVRIISFLEELDLHRFEKIVRVVGLKARHIIELSDKIGVLKKKGLIATFWEDLFLFEACLSISTGIRKNNFTFPSFTEKGIELADFYHPLLGKPVKNDFTTDASVVVVNGPNMSGKSTFLKALGICVYLEHLGLGIPASSARIPFFDNFFISINRRDDLQKGYSHFMTEIMNLKTVVEDASMGKKCFAVFDELFSGTNIEDGIEISRTTISGLSRFGGSCFFISTHLQQLKNVAGGQVSTCFLDCELKDNKPVFTYRIKVGWSEIKVGRILFEKEGLNKLLG